MASTSGTCPTCHHKVDDKHCQPDLGPKCPWWRCMACKIVFRGRDGKILPPRPARA